MRIEKFEDILVWGKSKSLVIDVYKVFEGSKDFSFRDQIRRASVSIMNNIAEGFERRTNNELRSFLYMSKGSSGEVRSMLYLALELGYINKTDFERLSADCLEISKMLAGFIRNL